MRCAPESGRVAVSMAAAARCCPCVRLSVCRRGVRGERCPAAGPVGSGVQLPSASVEAAVASRGRSAWVRGAAGGDRREGTKRAERGGVGGGPAVIAGGWEPGGALRAVLCRSVPPAIVASPCTEPNSRRRDRHPRLMALIEYPSLMPLYICSVSLETHKASFSDSCGERSSRCWPCKFGRNKRAIEQSVEFR